jgi:acyl carrier protein
VAYLTSQPKPAPSAGELRDFVQQRLPGYMVPSAFVVLDRFPLTNNGKVDRNALPEPDGKRPNLRNGYVAPRNELEKELTKTWEEVLQLSGIGTEDSFFELGGQSLQLVQLHGKLQQLLNKKFPITGLFQFTTIRSLAGYLDQTRDDSEMFLSIHKRALQRRQALAPKAEG